ncbi:ribosome-associated protein IOJAP [Ornatilinea apprima]|uniref:Ribosomal silencing factor RsfS n=1 Tax=Ornatilinea apprima TaxID=1134406 RepID=A0A0P6XDF0_9CHLR|nr:ribosome silencing factor [Ornatilinea apprima]KPL80828.1 ribosome-associated protein IOJAP [Ornatilinea apprima]NMC53850.1 ribosome silencing factor [Chloroflexota bacterium]
MITALEEKKAEDILLLDIRGIADFADFFIICSGTSDRMLGALADAAIECARVDHGIKTRVRGLPSSGWLIADLGDIVIHFFSPDQREYYDLEELWKDGKVLVRLK